MLWKLDPAHSSIEFAVKHMMIATVRGRFSKFDVTADIDPNDLSKTKAEVTVDVASIDTREEQRDNHLRSGDFFAITEHPTMTFITKRVEPKGHDEIKLIGDLTIRGVTKEVELEGEISGPQKDPWGGTRLGFSAEGKLDRKEFGLNWNAALEAGGWLVGDSVKIQIEAELVQAA